MTDINELIINTLVPLGLSISWQVYEPEYDINGKEKKRPDKWIVFDIDEEEAALFADNLPKFNVAYVVIDVFTPLGFNPINLYEEIRKRLLEAGFTYPKKGQIIDTKNKLRQAIFQCSIAIESEV